MSETQADMVMLFIHDLELRKDNPHLQGSGEVSKHLYDLHRLRDDSVWLWVNEQLWERRETAAWDAHRGML